jgi:ATP-dependent protease ClpP protease subunit
MMHNNGMKNLRWSGDIGYRDHERMQGIDMAFCEAELAQCGGDDITVELDTMGGDYFVGIQIMTMLKGYRGQKTVKYGAIVASAGTAVALGFDKRIARKTSAFMIHNAQSGNWGDQNDLRKTADQLEAFSNIIANEYAAITGKTVEEIKKMMDEETWMYGQEIVDAGFANEMEDAAIDGMVSNKAQAISMFKKHQNKIMNKAVQKPETVRDFEQHLRDVGYSKSQATAIASVGFRAGSVENREVNKVDKNEVLAAVKTMKENNGITLKEIAAAMGLEDQLADESVKIENKTMKAELDKVEADRVRMALDKEFGAESDTNPVRAYAGKMLVGMKAITPEGIAAIKADPIAKALAVQSATVGSVTNRLDSGAAPVAPIVMGGLTVKEV